MKVKIKGDIDADILARAFTSALKSLPAYQDNPDRFSVIGASIFFNFYDNHNKHKKVTFVNCDNEGIPEFVFQVPEKKSIKQEYE